MNQSRRFFRTCFSQRLSLIVAGLLSTQVIAESADLRDEFSVTTDRRGGYDWWSLQPLQDSEPPAASDAWAKHPIDRFVVDRLMKMGLSPSIPASSEVLLRRATYDLTGLPPTLEEAASFLKACLEETGEEGVVGDHAYEALLDRLLTSPHYGEQWGRHWLDVARFGESTGFEVNHLIDNAWQYRDYVIESFNADKPFDVFVREQLAGDSVGPGDPAIEVGLTFLVAGPTDIVGNQDPKEAAQIRANTIDEMIRATGEAFLGLTVGCARCHDHKFDAISQKDYYRWYATFSGVRHGDRDVGSDADHAARKEALKPLEEDKRTFEKTRDELIATIMSRAEERADYYEAKWTRPPVDRMGTEEVFPPVDAKFVRLVVEGRDDNPNARTGYRIDEFEVWTEDKRNVAASSLGGSARGKSRAPEDFEDAYRVDLVNDGKYGARWIAAGSELLIEFEEVSRVHRVVFSSDRMGAVSSDSGESVFVGEYRVEVSMDGNTWQEVVNSYDRRPARKSQRRHRQLDEETTPDETAKLADLRASIAAVNSKISAVPRLPRLRVGTYREVEEPTHVFLGGDPQRKGERVSVSSMETLSAVVKEYEIPEDGLERDRRLALAEWLTTKTNPLPPRVMMNRLWHYHFGKGIVDTPSDFGFMGGQPIHPELLDWLAREFINPKILPTDDQAWRLKRMHKLIMTSMTYRQGSAYRSSQAAKDQDSRYLWRFPTRRLRSEEIRDTMLAISGKLDTRMGGPGFRLYRYLRDNVSTYVPLDNFGPETYRRSVYHQNARAARIDLMTDFDGPDCALSTPRRSTTTSPLQALTLLNHTFTMDMAGHLAARIEREAANTTPDSQVELAFRLALGREVTTDEKAESTIFLTTHGLRALCRGLLNSNELVYLD